MISITLSCLLIALAHALPPAPTPSPGPSLAQREPPPPIGPCADDLAKFCDARSKSRSPLSPCLARREQELSPACRRAREELIGLKKLQREDCRDEIARFCGKTYVQGANCLAAHHKELSKRCAVTLKALETAALGAIGAEGASGPSPCRDDIFKYCLGEPREQGSVNRCLERNQDRLKPACRRSLAR